MNGKANLVTLMGIGLIIVNLLFSWQKEVLLKGSWS